MDSDSGQQMDFNKMVAERYDELTKSEKRIADFMRQNQDEVAFQSAAEIADQLELSEATMVRFARTLGFDSYPAMREVLQAKFRSLVIHSARIRSRLDDLRQAGDIFEQLVASEIAFLTEALQTVDRSAINAAIELLRAHQRVFVFGLGPSTSLVDMLKIRLTRSARHVITLDSSGREMLEPLLLMTRDDLLIAIGFFNMTPSLQLVLDHAHQHKTPVILVTDTLGDLVGNKATVTLAARRGPVAEFHSLVVPMTIINTLILALANEDREQVMTNLDRLDQLRERLKKANSTSS